MKAGKLDRRVTFERQGVAVDDGYTTKPGAWAPLASRACQIIRSRGREVMENQGIDADVPVTFLVRFDSVTSTITTRDRAVFEGRHYDLKSVNEISRRDGIELVGVANG